MSTQNTNGYTTSPYNLILVRQSEVIDRYCVPDTFDPYCYGCVFSNPYPIKEICDADGNGGFSCTSSIFVMQHKVSGNLLTHSDVIAMYKEHRESTLCR